MRIHESNADNYMKPVLAIILAVLFCAACMSHRHGVRTPPQNSGPELLIHVLQAGSTPEVPLSGVTVTMITVDGRELPLGETFGGNVRLKKANMRNAEAQLLLFCAQYFQCVALRVEAQRLYEFDEYYVDLPQQVFR